MKITTIIKRDGRKVPYNRQNIAVAIWKSLYAVGKFAKLPTTDDRFRKLPVSAAELIVSETELDKRSPEWKEADRLSKIVEQILIKSNGTHQWKVEEIQDVVEQALLAAGHSAAARAYILYRNKRENIRVSRLTISDSRLADSLGMSDNAFAAMARRYLRHDKDGNVTETPRQAMERVATAISGKVQPSRSRRLNLNKYLDIMTSFEFVPAGCYFRGAGNKQNGSLANCFVLPVEDSIEEIFQAVGWAARIHQLGGGVGYNFSHLRPRGDAVRSGGLASGPINFMKAFDAETQIVMQGGQHRGANMGILNVDHPDIFEFIRAKSIDGQVGNFNISVGATDKFMTAVEKGADWGLINPRDKSIVQKIPAPTLWEQIIETAHATGDPGMIYLDTINRFNPIMKALGPIEATNVCGEQVLHPFDVCNLGSINLAKFVIKPFWENSGTLGKLGVPENQKIRPSGSPVRDVSPNGTFRPSVPGILKNIRWLRLEEVIRTAVHFLDAGVDASTYPLPQIERMARQLRRIGLGVMGWADMLVKLGVRYDSDEGVKLAEALMKFIQQISWDESEKLAVTKTNFPLWKESYFNSKNNPFGKIRKVRNVAVTTIAPTGTISMIADCSSGIEPYFALEYTKNVVEKGGLKYTNKYYEEAEKAISNTTIDDRGWKVGIEDRKSKIDKNDLSSIIHPPPLSSTFHHPSSLLKNIFRTSHQISPDWHVKMQAAFQKYTDNAVSKTINFARDATVKDVQKAYLLAWKLGCKGITVYRDGSREHQILKTAETKQINQQLTINNQQSQRLMQSQMTITPLSQRAYQVQRQQIVESSVDGRCPDCGAVMEETEGCSLCRQCGYSKCSL